MLAPALAVLSYRFDKTARHVDLGSDDGSSDALEVKYAFWSGALGGVGGIPMTMGQRSAVYDSPRELTDDEYHNVTGGFANSAATGPRMTLEALLGGALGAGLGAGAGYENAQMSDGHFSADDAAPWLSGGAIAGAAAGMGHGAYQSAKNITAENIEHLDDGTTVTDRHPWLARSGGALAGAGAVLNPMTIPVGLGLGATGHAIEALRGRGHSGSTPGVA